MRKFSDFRIRSNPNNGALTDRRSISVSRKLSTGSNSGFNNERNDIEDFQDQVTERQNKELARNSNMGKVSEINQIGAQSLIKHRVTTKGERTYDLIYQKKSQNDIKYSDKSKINNNAVPIHNGTLSLMLNIRKKDIGTNLSHFKDKVTAKAKFKIKWKTIQWLIESKKEIIETLSSQYQLIIKLFRSKGSTEGMNREEFGELLVYLGLGAEKALGDRLFFIFDDDGNGTIDYRELIMGLETFKESAFKEKLQVFFDLCDRDGSGNITRKDFYDVLKRNCITEDEKEKLKKTINTVFNEADRNREEKLEKAELFPFALRNQQLQTIVEENIRSIRRIDKIIESDLEEPFKNWVPSVAGMANFREGVHFPLLRKFVSAIKEQEEIKYDARRRKQEYFEKMKKMKALAGQDESESRSENEL